jgi:hypothetical protein
MTTTQSALLGVIKFCRKASNLLSKGQYLGLLPLAQKLAQVPLPVVILGEGLGIPLPVIFNAEEEDAALEEWSLQYLQKPYKQVVPDLNLADLFSVQPESELELVIPESILDGMAQSSEVDQIKRAGLLRAAILEGLDSKLAYSVSAIDFFPAFTNTLHELLPTVDEHSIDKNSGQRDYFVLMLGTMLSMIGPDMRMSPLSLGRRVIPRFWRTHADDWERFCALYPNYPFNDEHRLSFLLATMNARRCPTDIKSVLGARKKYFYNLVCHIIDQYYSYE